MAEGKEDLWESGEDSSVRMGGASAPPPLRVGAGTCWRAGRASEWRTVAPAAARLPLPWASLARGNQGSDGAGCSCPSVPTPGSRVPTPGSCVPKKASSWHTHPWSCPLGPLKPLQLGKHLSAKGKASKGWHCSMAVGVPWKIAC